ncbi:helix-turn-helix transcriptional regulator [Sphaerisporangium sp. NPDC049002]|uniref:helix-turn-helix domain-containing protein n=1 Tax=Sphaerisporangium sp. NPDC049002 TaxID=3155392 RepID=UPI0033C27102
MSTISRFSREKLRRARLSAGLSQRQLAYCLDVSSSSVLRWEQGTCSPIADRLPQIAEILGIEIKDLFEEASDEVQD